MFVCSPFLPGSRADGRECSFVPRFYLAEDGYRPNSEEEGEEEGGGGREGGGGGREGEGGEEEEVDS